MCKAHGAVVDKHKIEQGLYHVQASAVVVLSGGWGVSINAGDAFG